MHKQEIDALFYDKYFVQIDYVVKIFTDYNITKPGKMQLWNKKKMDVRFFLIILDE